MTEETQPDKKHRWAKRFLVLFKLAGIVLFVYLLLVLDFDEILTVLRSADVSKLLLALLINITMLNTLKIYRWYLIVRWLGVDYPYVSSYLTYQSSIFMGIMTPGRMGELMRSVYLKLDRGTPVYKGIASVLIDRVFDLLGLLTLAGLALLLTPAFGSFGAAGWYFIAAAAVVFLILTLLRFLPEKTFASLGIFGSGFFAKTLGSLNHQLKHMNVIQLFLLILCTAVSLSTYAVQTWLIADALGLNLEMITSTGVGATATMVEVVPVTIYGLGTREAAVISLMGAMDIEQTRAFSFSLLMFMNFWVGGGLWAFGFWLLKPMRADKLAKQFKRDTQEEE